MNDKQDLVNTSYLSDSYIIFTLKMESVWKNTIFGLKMMVKSSLEKIFLKFLHAGDYFSLLHKSVQNHKFSNKNNHLPSWRDFKMNFSRPLFTVIFRPKVAFLNTDSILRVKTMIEQLIYCVLSRTRPWGGALIIWDKQSWTEGGQKPSKH